MVVNRLMLKGYRGASGICAREHINGIVNGQFHFGIRGVQGMGCGDFLLSSCRLNGAFDEFKLPSPFRELTLPFSGTFVYT